MDNIVFVPGKFLSTLSLRRATVHYDNYNLHCVISIHALLAESDAADISTRREARISIHALLAESDSISSIINNVIDDFYPRSPCGERPIFGKINARRRIFLSTLSLRRATRYKQHRLQCNFNFYPRSPCGERQLPTPEPPRMIRFLSTLSLRRATTVETEI